jgi:hypothetical protein
MASLGLVDIREGIILKTPLLCEPFAPEVDARISSLVDPLYGCERSCGVGDGFVYKWELSLRDERMLPELGKRIEGEFPRGFFANIEVRANPIGWSYSSFLHANQSIKKYAQRIGHSLLRKLERLRTEEGYDHVVGFLPLLIFTTFDWGKGPKRRFKGLAYKLHGGLMGSKKASVVCVCSNPLRLKGFSYEGAATILAIQGIAHAYGLHPGSRHSGPCIMLSSRKGFCDSCLYELRKKLSV